MEALHERPAKSIRCELAKYDIETMLKIYVEFEKIYMLVAVVQYQRCQNFLFINSAETNIFCILV